MTTPSWWRRLLRDLAAGPLRDTLWCGLGGLLVAIGYLIGAWATTR